MNNFIQEKLLYARETSFTPLYPANKKGEARTVWRHDGDHDRVTLILMRSV